MPSRLAALALIGMALLFASTPEAEACDGYRGCGSWGMNCYTPTDRLLPYFAEHPPVHYSVLIARPYGYSPYAYGPHVRTPERRAPRPLVLMNRHFPSHPPVHSPGKNSGERTADSASPIEPLVLINPFVPQRDTVAQQ